MMPQLHDYQLRAVNFLIRNPHAALFLEMGLGKTLVTLTAISRLIRDGEVHHALIVAPKKVAEATWTDECAKWGTLTNIHPRRIIGTQAQRRAALHADANLHIISRDSFVWLVNECRGRLPFDAIVLDELTSFKSHTSQRFKAFRLIRQQPARIIGLTGTPAPNGYEDLWAQLFCLDGGERLGRYITAYRNAFFRQVVARQGYTLRCDLLPGAREKIDAKIADICLSMRSADYLQLPPVNVIRTNVTLPEALLKRYQRFEREQVLDIDRENITAGSAAALIGKLQQFACGCVYDADHQAHTIHDERLDALAEIVEQAHSHVLVFYQYRFDLPRIKERLARVVKEVRTYDSEQELRDWNDGHVDVLLAHPASCAYGLNLQRGGHIIVWYTLTWNLEHYSQANARLYRQGQTHPVFIYQLVSPRTVDEIVLRALFSKTSQQEALMLSLKLLIDKYK